MQAYPKCSSQTPANLFVSIFHLWSCTGAQCTLWCNTGQQTSHGKPGGRSSWSHSLVRASLWCQAAITQPPAISHCIAIPLGPMCDYSSYDYHPVMGPLPACYWLTQMSRPLVGRRRGSNNRLSALAGRDAVQCSAVMPAQHHLITIIIALARSRPAACAYSRTPARQPGARPR